MANHRKNRGSRGISRSLVFTALAIVLVAGAVTVWAQVGDLIDDQADDQAGHCVSGPAEVGIIADPAVSGALETVAQNFNDTEPVIRDFCITVSVRPADANVTLQGLMDGWNTEAMGAAPAGWIPESSVWSNTLLAERPDVVDGAPKSLVSTPVVLATAAEMAELIGDDLDWADLPAQTRANSLAAFGARSWGSLRIAMPVGPQSDATALAATALAAAVTDATGPLTEEQAGSSAASTAITALMDSSPAIPAGTVESAVSVVSTDPRSASIRAVPITEQRLYLITRGDDPARAAAVRPNGPTPIADYPMIRLSGPNVDDTESAAVADFFAFAQQPEQREPLVALGFRAPDLPMPPATATLDFPDIDDPMPTPQPAATVTVNTEVYGRLG